jgi:hypothetical protein
MTARKNDSKNPVFIKKYKVRVRQRKNQIRCQSIRGGRTVETIATGREGRVLRPSGAT